MSVVFILEIRGIICRLDISIVVRTGIRKRDFQSSLLLIEGVRFSIYEVEVNDIKKSRVEDISNPIIQGRKVVEKVSQEGYVQV